MSAVIARAVGFVVGGALVSLSCASSSSPHATPAAPAMPASSVPLAASTEDAELDRVAAIHGAPGPWAVAGYRMGKFALAKLGLAEGSFDLEVTHHTPKQVMYSCIADGAAAATGASVGKLNLSLVDSTVDAVATTYLRKSTRQAITLRPTAKFRARFADAPRERARENGRAVLQLGDADIFEEVPNNAAH